MILFQLPPIFFLKSVFLLGGKNFILSLKCQSYLALIFNSEIGEGSLGQTFSVSNILNLVAAAELCCFFFFFGPNLSRAHIAALIFCLSVIKIMF